MNWADGLQEKAGLASSDSVSTDGTVVPRDASTAWEPHEVWLARIKRPRDLAARRRTEALAAR